MVAFHCCKGGLGVSCETPVSMVVCCGSLLPQRDGQFPALKDVNHFEVDVWSCLVIEYLPRIIACFFWSTNRRIRIHEIPQPPKVNVTESRKRDINIRITPTTRPESFPMMPVPAHLKTRQQLHIKTHSVIELCDGMC